MVACVQIRQSFFGPAIKGIFWFMLMIETIDVVREDFLAD